MFDNVIKNKIPNHETICHANFINNDFLKRYGIYVEKDSSHKINTFE